MNCAGLPSAQGAAQSLTRTCRQRFSNAQLLAHRGVIAAAVLGETEHGELKGSLRSIGDIDVASVAKKFGGGGHKNAAGLKIREPFADAQQQVIAELSKL